MTTATQPVSNLPAVQIPEPLAVAGISQQDYDRASEFRATLESNMSTILAVLPKGVRGEAVMSMALTTAQDNPELLKCEPLSLVRSTLKMATLGLRIGDTCDIVVTKKGRGANERLIAECWIRVRGVVELAIRSRAIQWAKFGLICQGETYTEEDDVVKHRQTVTPTVAADGVTTNVTHVYATITLASGAKVSELWTIDRVIAHRNKYAKGLEYDGKPNQKSPWIKDPFPMWGKTVVKAALRFAPLSPELRREFNDSEEVEGSWEVMGGDPTKALQAASGAMDQLQRLSSGEPPAAATNSEGGSTPQRMTLEQAENIKVGGKRLGDRDDANLKLAKAHYESAGNAAMVVAIEIILDARDDQRRTRGEAEDFEDAQIEMVNGSLPF